MSGTGSDRNSEATLPAGGDTSGGAPIVRVGLRRGDVVGRYVILGRLGAGGMGVVYAAYDPGLDRKVALKVLHPERDTEGRRLLREAQAMARLQHPNVVAVHDVGEHEGTVFLAMEYVDGSTLRRFLDKRSRSWRVVLRAFLQAGRGLAGAHAKGLVHRDFKPDNAMVDDDGAEDGDGPARVRVLDFGLARGTAAVVARVDDRGPMFETDAHSGTPAYMAPEQFEGGSVDAAADQFAFCVALFEALYGERPFEGTSVAALAASVTTGRMRPTTGGSDVPSSVRRVIDRGLSVAPRDRWPSMDTLLRELERDPTRQRRVTAGLFAAVAIIAAVLGVRELEQRRKLAACEAEGERVADVWNTDVAETTGAAFAGSSLAYANDTWTRARPHLDAFAVAWTEARVQVCREGTVEGTRRGRALELAEDCLVEQRGLLEAVAGQLADASPRAVERAVDWSAGLPEPGACTDDDAMRHRAEPPSDPAVRDALIPIHRDVATVRAMTDAGKLDEARLLADDVLARVEQLAWAPAVASARIAWADVAADAGEVDAAERALELAFAEAGTAGDDLTTIAAAVGLTYLVGDVRARTAEGLVWGQTAQMLVERLAIPERDPVARRVLNAVATVRVEAGEAEAAIPTFERLVELAREEAGADHPALASAIANLGGVEHERGHYDRALELSEEALAIRERALGPSHPVVATNLANIAAMQSRLDRGEDSAASLRRAMQIRTAIFGVDHPSVATTEISLAGTVALLGRHDEAVALVERALPVLRRSYGDHPDVAGALQNLGFSYARLGRSEDGIAALAEAVAMFRRVRGEDHRQTALAIHALAGAYAKARAFDEARASYGEALAIVERLPGEERHVAAVLGNLGVIEVDTADAEQGLAHCERAASLLGANERSLDVARARWCIGSALWKLGRDRPRALAVVRQARDQWAASSREVAELDTWLAAARLDGPPPPPLPERARAGE